MFPVKSWRRAVAGLVLSLAGAWPVAGLEATVEVEEEVYRHEPANNGAGPMWCGGSTCVVRVGDAVYATGLETIPDEKPLNNCRWVLWRRDAAGWTRWYVDGEGRTREPAPVIAPGDGRVLVSANPTLNPPGREGGGPARPEWFEFRVPGVGANVPATTVPTVPGRLQPRWEGNPRFSEHSYRSFAADPRSGAWIQFQNIDYTHAEWSYRGPGAGGADTAASVAGRLTWHWGAEYAKPQPIRVCYPNVAVRGATVHFCGVSDILDPNPAWRAYKKEITGREWDYDFRRLFYTWTPDVTREPFREWIEITGREATCGWVSPCDLWVAPDGSVLVVWTERAIDERLREKFFPEAKQSHLLGLARLKDGRVLDRRTLLESTEARPGPVAGAARFHELADGRLVMLRSVSGPQGTGNELVPISPEGVPGPAVRLALAKPFVSYFTATPRAGSASSEIIDVFGLRAGSGNALAYARIRVR